MSRRRYAIFLVFFVAYFLSYFFRSTNAVIADDLTRDLALSPEQLGAMTSLFFATFAAVQLPLGSLLDRYGARWVTPLLMLATVAGALVFAAAQSFATLALGRALIGLGMAGVLMGALKSFAGWFSAGRFATVSSLLVGLGSIGALVAATPLELITGLVGWRGAFVGGAAITVVSAALIVAVTRDPPEAPASATKTATKEDAGSHASGAASPGGYRRIFRSLAFWRIGAASFAATAVLFSYQTLWAGPYLREALELSSLATGNLLSAMAIGATAGYLGIGALADRVGIPRVMVAGGAGMVAAQVALAFATPAWRGAPLVALFVVFGVLGASSVLGFAHARAVFPAVPGRAVTAVNLLGIGGLALVQALLGVLIGALLAAGLSAAASYRAAFLTTAGVQAAALVFYAPLALRAGGRAVAAHRARSS